jgi:hypothetical protein
MPVGVCSMSLVKGLTQSVKTSTQKCLSLLFQRQKCTPSHIEERYSNFQIEGQQNYGKNTNKKGLLRFLSKKGTEINTLP